MERTDYVRYAEQASRNESAVVARVLSQTLGNIPPRTEERFKRKLRYNRVGVRWMVVSYYRACSRPSGSPIRAPSEALSPSLSLGVRIVRKFRRNYNKNIPSDRALVTNSIDTNLAKTVYSLVKLKLSGVINFVDILHLSGREFF